MPGSTAGSSSPSRIAYICDRHLQRTVVLFGVYRQAKRQREEESVIGNMELFLAQFVRARDKERFRSQ